MSQDAIVTVVVAIVTLLGGQVGLEYIRGRNKSSELSLQDQIKDRDRGIQIIDDLREDNRHLRDELNGVQAKILELTRENAEYIERTRALERRIQELEQQVSAHRGAQ